MGAAGWLRRTDLCAAAEYLSAAHGHAVGRAGKSHPASRAAGDHRPASGTSARPCRKRRSRKHRTAGSGGSADSELTGEQEQFDPEETENQTEQGQDTQPEQQPESKPQQEVLADAAIGTNTDSNKGDEGEEAGDTGETDENLPETELDLGALLTWYKYGSQASSMVCAPGDSVGQACLTGPARPRQTAL